MCDMLHLRCLTLYWISLWTLDLQFFQGKTLQCFGFLLMEKKRQMSLNLKINDRILRFLWFYLYLLLVVCFNYGNYSAYNSQTFTSLRARDLLLCNKNLPSRKFYLREGWCFEYHMSSKWHIWGYAIKLISCYIHMITFYAILKEELLYWTNEIFCFPCQQFP